MTAIKFVLLASGAIAALLYSAWWYRSREEPVPGRGLAAALRALVLFLAWAILVILSLPTVGADPEARTVLLVDASYSMSRQPSAPTAAPWAVALDSASRYREVWLFGADEPLSVPGDSLPDGPIYAESRLAPALRAVAATGARGVRVLTDGELGDYGEARDAALGTGLDVSVFAIRPDGPGVGIAGIDAPRWAELGDSSWVRVEIVAAGVGAEGVAVEAVDDRGTVIARATVPIPEEGRYSSLRLGFPIRGVPGQRRFTVRLADPLGDPETRDDLRTFYIRVMERPSGPVLISLRPDWEPSFLLPNLDRVTDAPALVFLSLGDAMVAVHDGYHRVALSTAIRRAREAPLLVLHGYDADAPAWARSLVQRAERLLLFPAGDRAFALPGWPVRIGRAAAGEWYLSESPPSSPLSLELSALAPERLPPILRLRSVRGGGAWTPLTVQRFRRGTPAPALVAGGSGRRRWAVAAGEGYWRWAFRPDDGRGVYRSVWTGLAGWLLEGRRSGAPGLDPHERVVPRGAPLRWALPPGVDSAVVRIVDEEESEIVRRSGLGGDTLLLSVPPGRYGYRVAAYREGAVATRSAGPAEVEVFTPELLPAGPAREASFPAAGANDVTPTTGRRGLAELTWPYLLLIGLFCIEWAVRRFVGLR